ncbi:hypothetical protein KP509_03G006800 [Ceratopteris richardii]|uniref:Expansin-like EG45 domain-containing protein n=1 Tax=Ceratopteris richardii TaxID=49495 RepID=A0A8T2V0R2_CERRI|nr:hypothetical protein KP509_03G006700 [Ceratopteris richardii]KAH7440701.1 hypothetical protein KP509_03G006800 [Ceratopteris richardii]
MASNIRTLSYIYVLTIVSCMLALEFDGAEAIAGRASYYTVYTPSACYGYDSSQFPGDGNFAAASSAIYNGGAACGQYYTIACTGNGCNGGGPISVKILDLCPGCAANQFDLSETAFSNIADTAVGVIDIDYSQ